VRSSGYENELTHEDLLDLLEYNPETGIFHWRRSRPGIRADRVAGTKSRYGYWQIMVRSRSYLAHRLAWFYVHGKWPVDVLDHIDGKKLNNRISNLRDVSLKENSNAYRRVPANWRWSFAPAYHF
jgi:hypothetical protein